MRESVCDLFQLPTEKLKDKKERERKRDRERGLMRKRETTCLSIVVMTSKCQRRRRKRERVVDMDRRVLRRTPQVRPDLVTFCRLGDILSHWVRLYQSDDGPKTSF